MNWKNYLRRRDNANYKHRMVGKRTPDSWLKRPNLREMRAIAKRFVKDGEIDNALETIRLMYPDAQLNKK